ncbi:MAG TPA: GNAT family N-acetyltransferase, partial [Rhodopila sp.]|nr:GNAT family N-acetyltransferase [Rhodopila sp.]
AANFYCQLAADVGTGRAILVGAWHDSRLVGSGLLSLDTPGNQRHRAELKNVLVLPAARRAGIGGMILHALEEQARAYGRSLLTLGTPATPAAELLCRSRNFTEAGRIPGYAVDAGGTPVDTVFFWKRLV